MTAPTLTEARVREIAREEIDRPAAQPVSASGAPAGEADEAWARRWLGPESPDREVEELADKLRKVREEERAKTYDAAAHQARVEALREAAHEYGTAFAPGTAVKNWLNARADRLEREQAKTAGAKEDGHGETDERRPVGTRGDTVGDVGNLRAVRPGVPSVLGGVARVAVGPAGDDRSIHVAGDGDCVPILGHTSVAPVTPAEAKGAPEQIGATFWTDGRISASRSLSPHVANEVTYVRADVVERRPAEGTPAASHRGEPTDGEPPDSVRTAGREPGDD